MAVKSDTFTPESAVAALMFLAERATQNLYDVLKMLYVADKRHLNDTGRFMFGDEYCAMKKGALPSNAYNLVKYVRGDGDSHYGFPEAKEWFEVRDNKIRPLRDVPEQFLSQSALTHLQEVAREHKGPFRSFWHWYRAAHDDAWKVAWDRRGERMSEEITPQDIAQEALRNDELLQYLND